MTTIRRCNTIEQATMLKLLLEGSGIEAFIPDEMSAGVAPFLFEGSNSGIRLQVAEEDAGEAERVLGDSGE